QLEAAAAWREIGRRTGDPIALRRAATAAERAAGGFKAERRMAGWARARCEQAAVAMLGAALFVEEGLTAAADIAYAEAAAIGGTGLHPPLAELGRLEVEARIAAQSADRAAVLALAARFDAPIRGLELAGRRRAASRLAAAEARADRARFLTACGVRLKDPMLLRMALDGLAQSLSRLDAAYEPVAWARSATLRAAARTALADLDGEIGEVAEAINDLLKVIEHVSRDHSPLDWARAQATLGGALQLLAEAGGGREDSAFDQAVGCLDRALTVFNLHPALKERAAAAHDRAGALVRRAELAGDLDALAEAEAAMRAELAASNATRDPVGWAVRQLNFARLYEARVSLTGRDRGERAAAALALNTALDVFGEHGLRTLADAAARSLERLKLVHG
ncbi:MAG: hypothetical protein JO303_13790, partial [Caulobacteraceae bacterium]|nr:hypothetical protein [Caulobacteraceae bacterium]